MGWADDVLRFWFEELTPGDWFSGRPELDAEIRRRFGTLREELKADPPDPATLDSDSFLAAIIVMDQFSRNMFRGSAEAFATDGLALNLADHAVAYAADQGMMPDRRLFIYMPFMHSEDPRLQARSVGLFRNLGMPEHLKYAEHHRHVLERFGRFPARNAALGRFSTAEELAFLESDDA